MVWPFTSWNSEEPEKPEEKRSGYECAPYTILETTEAYQVRIYPSRKWATVVHERHENDATYDATSNPNPLNKSKNWREQPSSKSFMKLFGYITGANESSAKISMTVPVSTRVSTVDQEDARVTREEMGFYVPEEHQAAPPPPTGEVNIVTRPEMTVFVKTFGGFAKDKDWREQKEQLLASLEGHPDYSRINTTEYYWNSHDAPFKFWNRKNEVFLVKNDA